MSLRRLHIPPVLTVTLLGLGAVECGPSAPPATSTINCDLVCRDQQTVFLQGCTPVPNGQGGFVCTSTVDAGPTFCAVTTVVMASDGACCCEPIA